MSNMKCPFCQQELNDNYYMCCNNPHCDKTSDMFGTEELWQALDRTKKQLEIAVDALKQIKPEERKNCVLVPTQLTIQRIVNDAIEQITALEQKEEK